MNTIKVFAEGVARQIHDFLPAEYGDVQCEIQEKLENNGVRLVGIEFNKPDSPVCPVIYMDSYYESIKQGKEVKAVMQNIANSYIQHERRSRGIEADGLIDYEHVKKWIEPLLLNTADNREMLAQMPHRKMADLSIFYNVVFPDQGDDMRASIRIENGHMSYWGISEQDLYAQAVSNMEGRENNALFSMDSLIAAMLTGRDDGRNLLAAGPGEHVEPLSDGMYVLTNEKKIYGASLLAVPGIMRKVHRLFPDGFYILPSSVHETIILPKQYGIPEKELGELVRDINRAEVDRKEQLSDCIYEYDQEKSVIRQVPESIRRREMER